jgi:TonB family protein
MQAGTATAMIAYACVFTTFLIAGAFKFGGQRAEPEEKLVVLSTLTTPTPFESAPKNGPADAPKGKDGLHGGSKPKYEKPSGGGGGGCCGDGDGVEVARGSLRPTITYREKAKYTEEARQHNLQGTVVLSVIFGADGGLHNIRVLRGLPDGLTEKAIEAARNIRFRPAVRNGVPISVRMTLEFNFALYELKKRGRTPPPLFQFGIKRRKNRCAAPRCNTSWKNWF